MLANLKRYRIIIFSILVTAVYTMTATFAGYFLKPNRNRSNRIIRNWSKQLLRIIDLDYQVFNPHQVTFEPGKNYIVMCNHSSLYDIPLSIMAIDSNIRMLAKQEIARIPFFGVAMKCHEFVFIDRSNGRQARQDLKLAAEKMMSGIILWIAPEGTRSRDGQLQDFKKGGFMLALQTGAIIIPLGIRGAFGILRPKSLQLNIGQQAQIHIGKPIDASQYSSATRQQLIDDVREAIGVAANL